jgi:hypothetical protein
MMARETVSSLTKAWKTELRRDSVTKKSLMSLLMASKKELKKSSTGSVKHLMKNLTMSLKSGWVKRSSMRGLTTSLAKH